MKDIGHEQTEEILKEIEKRISEEYARAEKEVSKKLDDYLEKFRVKDALKQKAVDNGLITEEEYKQWRVGQIMMTKRWTEMRDTLAEDFTNADKIARSIAYDHMPEVYAINHDYGTFQVEKGSLMDTSYTLYDRNAFEQLVKDEDTFIPAPGRKVSRDIKEGKALAWNKKQVQSVMMQGLLQGESIPNLATRLAKTVGESDRKAAIRNARTMTTGVQNAGRVASYDRANDMGIETRKQWLATLDDRTRHWHASLDGVTVDNDEPFENEYGDIMYPGDPSADPANIFNCRCTLIAAIKGFERDVSDLNLRHDAHLKDMTYEEWREGHYEQTSEPITRQEEISEQIKNDYIQDYIDINASIPDEVREGFDKFEDKYSNAKTEHYIAYDKDGNVIFESSNKGKTNVSVPKYIDEQNEGGYSIHNHPAEATFSVQDIRNYERYGQNGLVCDIEGNEYVLLNSNPSVDNLVKNAKTEDEVAELMPFSTAANKAFTEIDNDIMTRRREYSKELMATETDGSVRSAKMREWMAENNPEDLKNTWLEENAEKYGFEFKKQKLKGEIDTDSNTINGYENRITVVDNIRDEGYTKRTAQEFTEVAERMVNQVEEYSDNPSKWSGRIVVDNDLRDIKATGLKDWSCDIVVVDTAGDGTVVHELLHSCSGSYYGKEGSKLYRYIEEGSVEYLTQVICAENDIVKPVSYPEYLQVLTDMRKPLGFKDDKDFAIALFNVPLPKRYEWLEKRTLSKLKETGASAKDYKETLDYISVLKGGSDEN